MLRYRAKWPWKRTLNNLKEDIQSFILTFCVKDLWLGSAPTTTKKATWSCFVVFCEWHTTTCDIFFTEIGRNGRGFALVVCLSRVLVVFGRVSVVFLRFLARVLWFLANFFDFYNWIFKISNTDGKNPLNYWYKPIIKRTWVIYKCLQLCLLSYLTLFVVQIGPSNNSFSQ